MEFKKLKTQLQQGTWSNSSFVPYRDEREIKIQISGDRFITQFLAKHIFETYCGHFESYFDRKFKIFD
ncbi:hypothetical protein GTQ43_32635 [Nostoc sp. KVJ3]|uniref:hypothetical protein n=1 Tax=Nostoc sp. KVJ3 TaxID=457945 RepID=UPI0022373FE6|nr:hypothetical protein [Nostoc sp. KVJ3]MCW5318307.1 hypothetical protein [Nostoc sp. KVJ3]